MGNIYKIAHRGASGYAPENTMAAFKKAIDMGAASIEFDVQQTSDGKLVVIHDSDLKRVGGVRKKLAKMSYAELSRVDVGRWFDESFSGEKIPRLEEVLELVRRSGKKIKLQLEIKNDFPHYEGIEKRIVDLLDAQWRKRIVISSFDHPTLFRVRSLDADARLGYLAGLSSMGKALRESIQLGCESVHLSTRRISRTWVRALHAAKKEALVYTVNTAEELARMVDLEVDGVFTNFPDLRPS